ncbi:MAG: hypothetical protein IKO32_02380 [Lachnospiraceae bacterium]|nr:hypothetical protein [Lachnospiraceae bacterium]
MKYSMDTYRLYSKENVFSFVIRAKVTMKEEVDIEVLRHAANVAIKRYPYFAKEVVLGDDEGYKLIPNRREIVVIPTSFHLPDLCTDEVNRHLLFLDTEGRDIYFNISHSITGGKGSMPWIMTTIYQYIVEKYKVKPNAPEIRKPDSDLFPGEDTEPSVKLLSNEEPIYTYKSKKPVVLVKDYLNGMYNPFKRDPVYYQYTFEQKDIVSFIRENDASVASFFLSVAAMALDKVLPEKYPVIGGEIAHFPGADIGLPNSHCDLLSHVHIDYDRKYLRGDMEKLGTITRGQIILQTDPTVVQAELRRTFSHWGQIDLEDGLKNKIAFNAKNDPFSGKEAQHGTFISNYSGRMDWGEVADYVEAYILIVEGHILLEVSAVGDKIFVAFMQLFRETKYVDAFGEVLGDLKIPFKVEGPFPKNQPKHCLPKA